MTALAIGDPMKLAETIADAELFIPDSFKKAARQRATGDDDYRRRLVATVGVALMFGQSVGLDSIRALNYICVVNGRPALYDDAPMGLAMNTGQVEAHQRWVVNRESLRMLAEHEIPEVAEAARVRLSLIANVDGDYMCCLFALKRTGQQWHVAVFDTVDANRAGLFKRNPTWRSYPQRMLFHRARAFAVRNVFPDVMVGMYTRSEVVEMTAEETRETDHEQARRDSYLARNGPRAAVREVSDLSSLVDDPITAAALEPGRSDAGPTICQAVVNHSQVVEVDARGQSGSLPRDMPFPVPEDEGPPPSDNDLVSWDLLKAPFKLARPALLAELKRERLSLRQYLQHKLGRDPGEATTRKHLESVRRALKSAEERYAARDEGGQ